jgi:hypothetical protein
MEVALPELSLLDAEKEFLPSFQLPYQTAPWLGEIYDWAANNVVLPHGYVPPGSFDVSISPYLIEPFQAIKDTSVRQVCIMAPPRSGKTLLAEITLLYLISNSPGHILWVQATDKAKNKMSDARMSKLLKMCNPVQKLIDPNDRWAVTQNRYRFTNGIECHLANATLKSLQSFGYKYVVFDECWLADPGLISEAQARIGDYQNTYKIILISQGGDLGINPDWEIEFNKGIIKEYGFKCPKCSTPQLYYFNHRLKSREYAGLYWPRDKRTYIDGDWLIEEAANLSSIKCVECGCFIEDTPHNRDYLHRNSFYITTQEKGNKDKRSFRYNALGTGRVCFSTITKEWLEADKIYNNTGDVLPKHQFRQKRLAETPGREKQLELLNLNVFCLPEDRTWKPGTVRFLTVDVQRKAPRFWYVCREWAKDGESRKIQHGYCHTWEELDILREKLRVRKFRVFVDAGDGQNDDEIFTHCALAGGGNNWGKFQGKPFWYCYNATKGFGLRVFKENGNKPFKIDTIKVNLPATPMYKGVYGPLFFKFSNPRLKTVLQHLRDGKGVKWLSNDEDPEYQNQMISEIAVPGKTGVEFVQVNQNAPNEFWDCEVLQVMAALHYGYLTVNAKVDPVDEQEEKSNV